MPLYTYKCHCGETVDEFRSISDRNEPVKCECGGEMEHIIVPTQVNRFWLGSTDNPGYKCPVTNKFITSKRERLNVMREHNLIEAK